MDAANPMTAIAKIAEYYSKSYGINSVAFRYFNAASVHSTGEIGECRVEKNACHLNVTKAFSRGLCGVSDLKKYGVNRFKEWAMWKIY